MERATQEQPEQAEYPLHWQRAFGTDDPQVVLRALDEARAKVGALPWTDSAAIIRESRDAGLARE